MRERNRERSGESVVCRLATAKQSSRDKVNVDPDVDPK